MIHIEAEHVCHRYGQGPLARQVLNDINLDLNEQRIGVIGHNGSGKSTFIRMIDALLLPSEGTIKVEGLDTATEAAKIRKLTGFLFTDPDTQIIMPTVSEDVAFGLRKSGLSKEETTQKVEDLLAHFGLADHRSHPAHLLSGGQKQLLALCSVLITDPKLIIMDEPTTLLDLRNARLIGKVISELQQTVVLATHHLYLLEEFDRVVVFDSGRVVADGAPGETVAFYRKLMSS